MRSADKNNKSLSNPRKIKLDIEICYEVFPQITTEHQLRLEKAFDLLFEIVRGKRIAENKNE